MKSSVTASFWKKYLELPAGVQKAARKQYLLWVEDQRHPSLQFKRVGTLWSARITEDYRSLALFEDGTYYWFWIGTHADYTRILKSSMR